MTSASVSLSSALTFPTLTESGRTARSLEIAWSTSSSRWARMITREAPPLLPTAVSLADCRPQNSFTRAENTTVFPAPVGSTTAGRRMPSYQA